MSDLKILLVEDNPLHAQTIELVLNEMNLQLAGHVDNALDALDLFQSIEPDLILLDVHITGSFTGIEFAERIRKTSAIPIIYVSSERDKKTFNDAKATQPDAFVFKPIVAENLISAIEIALNKPRVQKPSESQKVVLNEMIFVRIGNSLRKISINDIVYINTSAKNYCDIVTVKKSFPVKTTLTELHKMLPEELFIKTARSHILNLTFLEEIDERNYEIETNYGIVPLSKSHKSDLYDRLRKA